MQTLRHILLAVQYFTRIPLPGPLARWVGFDAAALKAGMAWLPLVGALVGGASALVLYAALWLLPPFPAALWAAVLLCMAASVWLTGAFHEDGLADTADALGGHVSRARALEIMKDSRIGSYGTVALLLALMFKATLLVLLLQIAGLQTLWVLLAAHIASRGMPLLTIRLLPHVGDDAQSKTRPLAHGIATPVLTTGLACAVLLVGLCALTAPVLPWWGALGGCALGWAWITRLLQRRLQGFTGDGLGTVQQISELGFYLGLLVAMGANSMPGHSL